ncbi:protein WVD2-like 7 isoform X2 [Hibiscus syriacus]|uniref:protein WVD2-like 7 isoform X2 n=1 Tax=Hibiscus syriacus TaxID=106335 RepID=UPI0019210A28|nr:protein WVD2-like 7 isoform X2 [Hibiscus syriacus]
MASSKEFKAMGSSNPALEVSVSFGRFENDSLSWEKWSTFSPNKYLEEVEKCATPGSVAQKKAYFEEHYKKIAARKAELLAQERSDERDPTRKSEGDEGDKQEICLLSEVNDVQETEIATKCQDSWVEELNERINGMVENEEKQETMGSLVKVPVLNEPEETSPEEKAFLVKKEMETPSKGSQDVVELSSRSENAVETTPEIKDKNLKLGQSAKSHKITALNKERNDSRMKKKPASPVTLTPQLSTSRASKTTLTPITMSASRSQSKRGTALSYSSTKIKNSSVVQSKKVAPRSLHMSLRVDPSSPDPASLPATRKSLFMEKMGDKDIVKRAFKTFQSNNNRLKPSCQEQSAAAKPVLCCHFRILILKIYLTFLLLHKFTFMHLLFRFFLQAPAKGRESRVPTLTTPQKENGGSSKVGSMEKKNAKAAPSYSGLKSDERAEWKKEFSKKPEGKSNDGEAVRRYLQTKAKDNRDAEIRKLRQSLNFKATPLPGFYHGQRTSKSPLDKIGSKSDIHR